MDLKILYIKSVHWPPYKENDSHSFMVMVNNTETSLRLLGVSREDQIIQGLVDFECDRINT